MVEKGELAGEMERAEVPELENLGNGVWRAPGARIIDRTGRKRMPVGYDGWADAEAGSVLVDKTMLAADVLDSGYKVTLFCRPRRFGKTLNMTMLKAFFELPPEDDPSAQDTASLFEGTEIWEAEDGRYREHQGAYPVVHVSFNTVKRLTWEESYGAIKFLVSAEYRRHAYLKESEALLSDDRDYVARVMAGSGAASDEDYAESLRMLTSLLRKHHGRAVVVLVDEYDAPVMAGYTNGYYREVVGFLKGWLTGALKDGGAALAFACLTGVQRITKESIFSDLNNLRVSTSLDTRFGERYGFTDAEVAALASYLGHPDCMPEARMWYDGYRFGNVDVYNPWSMINYFDQDCAADVYWGNTSGNSVLGGMVRAADSEAVEKVYALLEPGGTVLASLDLGVVFPDGGSVPANALWSMLYLAGYVTTEDVAVPNNIRRLRPLRVPNLEVSQLFRGEIIGRFADLAGDEQRLYDLHRALLAGDEGVFCSELARVARDSASAFDLASESSCHMLMLGLLFGVPGYLDPVSNREEGYGRFDIRLAPAVRGPLADAPAAPAKRPLVTLEVKFLASKNAPEGEELDARLRQLAAEALAQIVEKGYDVGPLPPAAEGRLRWGVAFCGKHVGVACERVK